MMARCADVPDVAFHGVHACVQACRTSGRTETTPAVALCGPFVGTFFLLLPGQVAAGKVQGARLCGRPVPDLGADGLHLASPGERCYPPTPHRAVAFCPAGVLSERKKRKVQEGTSQKRDGTLSGEFRYSMVYTMM